MKTLKSILIKIAVKKIRMDHYKKNRSIPDNINKIHKSRIGLYNGYKIYYVDGEYIRDTIDVDFCEGGNPGRYTYIPLDEIWIDEVLDKVDVYATMVHEYLEMGKMIEEGWSYNRAHDYAAKIESKVRKFKYKGEVMKIFKDIVDPFIKEGRVNRSIGWTDTSNPHGRGYQIMTEEGIKVYDANEYGEFKDEIERVKEYLHRHGIK